MSGSLHACVAGWLLGTPSGANRRLLSLLEATAPQLTGGERITVLHRPDFAPPPLPRIEWHAIGIPARPTLARVRAERRLLRATLQSIGANVYEHGFLPLPTLPVPTALLLHDLRAVDGLTRWPRWLARAVLRRSLRRATTIVVPSQWTAARVAELWPEATPRIAVVPNGVDRDSARAAGRSLPRPTPNNGFLLHVGHLEARKNITVVIDALARLPAAARPALWLVGADAGQRAPLVARAAALGIGDALHWFGTVDEQLLATLYHYARAVVVPSRYEGFGLPVLEAFAHGTAVLAANATALPEVANGHATLLPPDDVAAWARAITECDRSDQQPAVTRAHRIEHAASFAWANAAARWLELLRRTAASPAAPI